MRTPVLVYAPRGDAKAEAHRASALGALGFEVTLCTTLGMLRDCAVRLVQEPAAISPVFAVLRSSLQQNCVAAHLLRAISSDMGVVACLDTLDEPSMVCALQCGADSCSPADASPQLVASILFSLLRWRSGLPATAHTAADQPEADDTVWMLPEQAWVLQNPEGKTVRLTTSERAFLLVLAMQPGRRARHQDLYLALEPTAGEPPTSRQAQARLGVLVSRLRRKLQQQHGIDLPVKSLYRWGYMFTAGLRT